MLAPGPSRRPLEVVPEQWPVVRVGAVVDDALGAPSRREAAQIGQALLGDETCTSCSVWSTWLAIGTMHEMAPPLAVEGVTNMEMKALRAKSPEPPMPFWMREPMMWVELTLP